SPAPRGIVSRRRLNVGQLAHRFCAELSQRRRIAIDRMAAPVQTERFLLEGQLLALGPRLRLGQRHRASPTPMRRLVLVEAAEQLRLPLIAVALRACAVLARAV